MNTITTYWCKKPAHLTKVIIGDGYEYQPVNPAATRNRGRQGTLLEYGPYQPDTNNNATIKWLDTKRTSKVDIGSFIHSSDVHKTKEQLAKEASAYYEQKTIEWQNQPLSNLPEPIEFEFENGVHLLVSVGKIEGEPMLGIKYPRESEIRVSKFGNLPSKMKIELIDLNPDFFIANKDE